jgi:hypothetical protein
MLHCRHALAFAGSFYVAPSKALCLFLQTNLAVQIVKAAQPLLNLIFIKTVHY